MAKSKVWSSVGKHCIVRTKAGVYAGIVEARSGEEITMSGVRRIWFWRGAFTCSEMALSGIDKAGSRVAAEIHHAELITVAEVIPTTPEARAKIEACTPDGK
jgi:hypothetical protein